MHRVVSFFAGCSLTVSLGLAHAQSGSDASIGGPADPQLPESIFDEGLDLDELLTTEIDVASTKSRRTSSKTPSTVSVIDRQQLETYNFRDVG